MNSHLDTPRAANNVMRSILMTLVHAPRRVSLSTRKIVQVNRIFFRHRAFLVRRCIRSYSDANVETVLVMARTIRLCIIQNAQPNEQGSRDTSVHRTQDWF